VHLQMCHAVLVVIECYLHHFVFTQSGQHLLHPAFLDLVLDVPLLQFLDVHPQLSICSAIQVNLIVIPVELKGLVFLILEFDWT